MNKTDLSFMIKNLMAALMVILSLSILHGQSDNTKKNTKKKFKLKPDITVEFEARKTYDDNILKYSEKYLERFKNREDEGRFHINTYDDVISRPSLKISASQKLIKKLSTAVQFNMNRSFFLNNGIKSWSYFSFGIDQYFSKNGFVNLSYSYIPNFYIRHFRDEDYVNFVGFVPEAFKPMAFSKETYDFYTQYTFLKNTGVRLSLDYARYFYNVHYIEYDSNDFSYEIRILQPLSQKLRLQAAYTYTFSDAKGFDEFHETKENSNDADATFYDNNFFASLRWALPAYFKLNHSLTFSGSYAQRNFSSPLYVEIDPMHAGRIDYNYRFSLLYRVRVNRSVSATVFYNYLGRRTSSRSEINREYISLEKDYNQNQIGFSLIYNYKLKY